MCRVISNFVSVKIFESEKPSLWDSKLNLQRLKELSQATKTIQKNKFPLDSRLESQKCLLVAFELKNKYTHNVENKMPTKIYTGV